MRKQLISLPERYDDRPHGLSHAVVNATLMGYYTLVLTVIF